MNTLSKGIRIDERTIPWGTRLDDATRTLGGSLGRDGRTAAVPCAGVYGFRTLFAELSAPATDRPVMTVRFVLAPERGAADPTFWTDRLCEILGRPTQDKIREVPAPRVCPACRSSTRRVTTAEAGW